MPTATKKKSKKQTARKKTVRKTTARKTGTRSAGFKSFAAVMADLEKAGTAQNRKVYARHGVTGKQFGVPFSFLRPYAKKQKGNHDVAVRLWATGNHDAMYLACMIADGDRMTSAMLDSWVKDVDNYGLADGFGGLVARSPHALAKAKKWTKQKAEFVRRCGYNTVASMVVHDRGVPIAHLKELLARIEKEIHSSENYAKESMNRTLIAIGSYVDALEKPAIAAAKRIGTVEIDHGQTGCKTPDAAPYIVKAVAHRKKKQRK